MRATWPASSNIGKTMKKNPARFKPTAEMISAAEAVFLAMAFEQAIRPIVEGYQRKILAERSWNVSPEFLTTRGRSADTPPVEYVTNIKDAWTMAEPDFALFLKRCKDERIAAKLHVQGEQYCPLLVAEDMARKAKHALCDAMACVTSFDASKASGLPINDYNNFIEITLQLLAPFVDPKAALRAA
jgi:hypothetical protein